MADIPKPDAAAPASPVAPAAPEAPVTNPEPTPAEESQEVKDLRAKAAKADELQFKVDLGEVAKTYPKATDYEAKIKEKVAKGYSAVDAALIVLHENNALQTAPAPGARGAPAGGFGGSMDTPPPRESTDPAPGTPEAITFYADRFKDLEAKGEIRLT